MFPIPLLVGAGTVAKQAPPLLLYNTLSRTAERFEPIKSDYVRLYHCGPTVYDFAHIGNLRAYVFADILKRTLILNGYKVRQVMNITDVGHLTSDADDGDDKMTIGMKREGLPLTLEGMRELGSRYTEAFLSDLDALDIKRPNELPRASEHVQAMIALIQTLMEKEYAYQTTDGVYFDTARFASYGALGGVRDVVQLPGARIETNSQKRHAPDFALWKRNDTLGWDSPWGKGFPGWHIECSAMSMEALGKEIDIHTGGVDHIGTHHNNEIAQSEASTGRTFVRYWMHVEHLHIEGMKVAKSLGNSIKLRQLVDHGYDPLAYRFWLLSAHYRTQIDFSFPALDASAKALLRVHRLFAEELGDASKRNRPSARYSHKLQEAMNDDLNTPKALAVLFALCKDSTLSDGAKRATLLYFDKVLGLGLTRYTKPRSASLLCVTETTPIPETVHALIVEREKARKEGDFARADQLRDQIISGGFVIQDTPQGTSVRRV